MLLASASARRRELLRKAGVKFQTEIAEKVFENYGDRYAKDCTPGN